MSYASKLKQNKEAQISQLENDFKLIIIALKNLENIIVLTITKDPYTITFSFNNENINLNYNLITEMSTFEIPNTDISIKNISYETLKEKGLLYQIRCLLDSKTQEYQTNFDKVKSLIPNHMAYSIKDNILEITYKNQHTFILSLKSDYLKWDIEYDMHSFKSENITTKMLVEKGLAFYFEKLINAYLEYEYGSI